MFFRFFLAFAILVLVMVGVSTSWFYVQERNTLLTGIDSKLFATATLARELLPPDYHDRIRGADSVSDAEYLAIIDRYNRLCVTLGLEYIWSLIDLGQEIRFSTATSPDKMAANRKHAAFFELHSNPELYVPTLTKMQPTYQINDDKWGRIRVVLLPFRDAAGRPYLFGASMRLSEVDAQLSGLLLSCLFGGIALLGCGIILALVLARIIAQPLGRLAEVIRGIASGESGLSAAIEGSREQADLALSFNRMNEAIVEARALAEAEGRTIRANLEEKEVLLREIHHRVKNNLTIISSLLSLQASEIRNPEEALAAFEVSGHRILAMALVHEELYKSEDLARVDMAEYLDSLSRQLVDAYSSKSRVAVVPETEGIVLSVDIAIPCGLIFNELITNALKHAFPGGGRGTIRASLKALDSGRFELSVRDDGVGLPEGAMVPESQALGVALVRLLVEQLDGSMKLSTSEGTCCTIVFSGRPRG